MDRTGTLAAALVAVLSTACATAIPLPPVEDHELRGVELEAGGSSVAELDRERNLRYWEITLTDEQVLGQLSAEDRNQISSLEIRDAAGELHERFSADAGMGVLDITRLSPSAFREAAARSEAADSGELYEAADYVDQMQAVVHRRIHEVGSRVAAAAGRPDVSFIADGGFGLNASVRSSSARIACSWAPSSRSPPAPTTSSPARSATSSRT